MLFSSNVNYTSRLFRLKKNGIRYYKMGGMLCDPSLHPHEPIRTLTYNIIEEVRLFISIVVLKTCIYIPIKIIVY
jgi:hypothetical protein